MLSIILGILVLAVILIVLLMSTEEEEHTIEKVSKVVLFVSLNIGTFVALNYTTIKMMPYALAFTGYIYAMSLLLAKNVKDSGAKCCISTNVIKYISMLFISSIMLLPQLMLGVDTYISIIYRECLIAFTGFQVISNAYRVTSETFKQMHSNIKAIARK